MIVSANTLSVPVLRTDIAVIGGGASGLALASSLSRDAIVIEGGSLAANPDRDKHFVFETSGLQMNTQSLRRRLVGGAGALWSGRCAPLDPVDLIAKPWANQAGWPIAYETLEPFLEAALLMLKLPSVNTALDQPSARKLKALSFGETLEPQLWQFARRSLKKGLHLGSHLIKTFEAKGKVLLTEADAIGLKCDGRKVVAVLCRDRSGREVTVIANHFVLACGCIEASRFLLQTQQDYPELLGSVDRWLGRGFHQHLLINAGMIATTHYGAMHLQKMLNNFRIRPKQEFELGLRLTKDVILGNQLLAASAALRYEPRFSFNIFEKAHLAFNYARGVDPYYFYPKISVEFSVEQAISHDNRIYLGFKNDINGQEGAIVQWTIGDLELITAEVFSKLLSEMIHRNKLGFFQALGNPEHILRCQMRDSLHHLGGTQMSESASTGVVDRNLKVHGVENLYIVGGSVFPSGGHVNPTLTIIALAIRMAHHLDGCSTEGNGGRTVLATAA